MTTAAVVLAFASAFCFGAALVLTQLGLPYLAPLAGAAIAIPSSTLLLICISPVALADSAVAWNAVLIFAAVGLLYPGAATLLTFAANRALGPVITGTLGNLAPLFAVALAFVMLGEPLRPAQLGGLVAIVAGVVLLTAARADEPGSGRVPGARTLKWPRWPLASLASAARADEPGSGRVPGARTLKWPRWPLASLASAARGADPWRWRSWFLLLPLLAAAIRGFIQPAIKFGLEIWPSPFAASLMSYIVSAVIVIAAARLTTGQFVARAPLRGRLWFVGVGLCNGLAVLLMYAALAQGPVTLVSPLVATYPLVTVIGTMLFLGKIDGGGRLVAAVALTVGGVALLLAG